MPAPQHQSPHVKLVEVVRGLLAAPRPQKRHVKGEHVNQMHPYGTAGHAVAPRHHAPVLHRSPTRGKS